MPVSANKSMLAQFSANQRAAKGKHAIIITDARRHYKEGGDNVMAVLQFKILKDPDDANSHTGRPFSIWWTTMLTNDDIPGHKPPAWTGRMSCSLLSALFPEECVDYPRFDCDTKQLMFRGEVISTEDERNARDEANLAALEKTAEVFGEEGENLKDLVGHMMYVDMDYPPGSNFVRFKEQLAELPDDWELSDVYVELDVDEVEEEEVAPKKKAKKKTTRRRRG